MIRDTTDVKRRVMTQPLVVRNHKPLRGVFATALFLAGARASSGVAAAIGEQFCTHGGQDPQKGDSVACYSDAGGRFAASLGAEPVRNFSPSSAPFALARGKITGIITSSSGLITQIKKVDGSCRRITPPSLKQRCDGGHKAQGAATRRARPGGWLAVIGRARRPQRKPRAPT